jgi:hypothetical protein
VGCLFIAVVLILWMGAAILLGGGAWMALPLIAVLFWLLYRAGGDPEIGEDAVEPESDTDR